jgi:hypothetical protein
VFGVVATTAKATLYGSHGVPRLLLLNVTGPHQSAGLCAKPPALGDIIPAYQDVRQITRGIPVEGRVMSRIRFSGT